MLLWPRVTTAGAHVPVGVIVGGGVADVCRARWRKAASRSRAVAASFLALPVVADPGEVYPALFIPVKARPCPSRCELCACSAARTPLAMLGRRAATALNADHRARHLPQKLPCSASSSSCSDSLGIGGRSHGDDFVSARCSIPRPWRRNQLSQGHRADGRHARGSRATVAHAACQRRWQCRTTGRRVTS